MQKGISIMCSPQECYRSGREKGLGWDPQIALGMGIAFLVAVTK